jgi:hypothetical protein
VVTRQIINSGFWILSRIIWILIVTTKVIHFTNLHHINFTVESSVRRLLRSALNWLDPSMSVSSVSHLLKRVFRRPSREHLIEGLSLSVHENTSVDSQRLFVATRIIVCPCRYNGNASVHCLGNSLLMYALLCERVYNCHLDSDKENLVTEPLPRNGRPLRFRYSSFRLHATIIMQV